MRLSGTAVKRILIGRNVIIAVSERAAVIVKISVKVVVLVRARWWRGWRRRRFRLRRFRIMLRYVELSHVIRIVAIRAAIYGAVSTPIPTRNLWMVRQVRSNFVCTYVIYVNTRNNFSLQKDDSFFRLTSRRLKYYLCRERVRDRFVYSDTLDTASTVCFCCKNRRQRVV